MKILCMSDTHGRLPNLNLQNIDLVLHAGDWTYRNKLDYIGQIEDFETRFLPWINNIRKKVPFYWTLGNHETFYEYLRDDTFKKDMKKSGLLLDEYTVVNGLKIWGNPWTPYFCGWGFNEYDTPQGLGEIYKKIPEDVNIIISHGPVYGIHDIVEYPHSKHAGSKELASRVKEIKPKLIVSGHLHDDANYGWIKREETLYIGASLANEKYEFSRNPITIEV